MCLKWRLMKYLSVKKYRSGHSALLLQVFMLARKNKLIRLTAIPHVGAVFASWNTAGTIFPVESLFVQVALHKLIGNAHAAIHPAGSNKFFLHWHPPHKICEQHCKS
jgi:hypothetical protein